MGKKKDNLFDLHPSLKNAPVVFVGDEGAKLFGLETEEQKKAYLEQYKKDSEERERRYIESKLPVVKGKPTDKIPEKAYCYERYISPEDEIKLEKCKKECGEHSEDYFDLYYESYKRKYCPYFKFTEYGTVICEFLEDEALDFDKRSYEKALKHFGSAEEIDRRCSGSIALAGSCRICNTVLKELEKRSGFKQVR